MVQRAGAPPLKVLYDRSFKFDTAACASADAPYTPPRPSEAPRISPDGRYVAYVDQVGSPDSDIYTVSPATGEVRRLTIAGGDDLAPVWSPDGRMIAFVNETDSTVYVMNADGSGRRLIARDTQDVAWSSDGTALVIGHSGTKEREGELDVATREGKTLRKLTTGDLFVFSVSWAPADEIAYVQDNGDQNQDKCGS